MRTDQVMAPYSLVLIDECFLLSEALRSKTSQHKAGNTRDYHQQLQNQ